VSQKWSEQVELKEPGQVGNPIYKFNDGHNLLFLDLSKPPRDVTTRYGPKKVVDGRTEDGQEVSVFFPAGSTETSAYGQLVLLARKYGEKEHLVDVICLGAGKNRRYTILHSNKCKCGKK